MAANLSADHIAELWRRMSRIYGGIWEASFGPSDDDTWLRGLSDFTAEDLSIGLEACTKQAPDEDGKLYPPNLPQFRALCRPKNTKPAFHDEYIPLPKPSITKEEALEHLRKIRESL